MRVVQSASALQWPACTMAASMAALRASQLGSALASEGEEAAAGSVAVLEAWGDGAAGAFSAETASGAASFAAGQAPSSTPVRAAQSRGDQRILAVCSR